MKKLATALLLVLALTGCGRPNQDSLTTTVGRKDTAIEVKKSDANTQVFVVKQPEANLKEAMDATLIPYSVQTRGNREVVTQLSGVIVTTGKAWKLYVDNELKNFTKLTDITLEKGTKISWRYEEL